MIFDSNSFVESEVDLKSNNFSYISRIRLLFCATYILRCWQLKLVAAAYLFYLVFTYFLNLSSEKELQLKISLISGIIVVFLTYLAFFCL